MIFRKKATRPGYKKYKNKSRQCKQGHLHDSYGEGDYCDKLAILKKAGEIRDYEIQKTFHLKVNGITICQHRVDFLVTTLEGKLEVNEYKGFATAVWRIKMKLFKALWPEIPYIVITH